MFLSQFATGCLAARWPQFVASQFLTQVLSQLICRLERLDREDAGQEESSGPPPGVPRVAAGSSALALFGSKSLKAHVLLFFVVLAPEVLWKVVCRVPDVSCFSSDVFKCIYMKPN